MTRRCSPGGILVVRNGQRRRRRHHHHHHHHHGTKYDETTKTHPGGCRGPSLTATTTMCVVDPCCGGGGWFRRYSHRGSYCWLVCLLICLFVIVGWYHPNWVSRRLVWVERCRLLGRCHSLTHTPTIQNAIVFSVSVSLQDSCWLVGWLVGSFSLSLCRSIYLSIVERKRESAHTCGQRDWPHWLSHQLGRSSAIYLSPLCMYYVRWWYLAS